jgi:hypothetical protein
MRLTVSKTLVRGRHSGSNSPIAPARVSLALPLERAIARRARAATSNQSGSPSTKPVVRKNVAVAPCFSMRGQATSALSAYPSSKVRARRSPESGSEARRRRTAWVTVTIENEAARWRRWRDSVRAVTHPSLGWADAVTPWYSRMKTRYSPCRWRRRLRRWGQRTAAAIRASQRADRLLKVVVRLEESV